MDSIIYNILVIIMAVTGYSGPDGLASSGGRLFAAIESEGTVISFDSSGSETLEYSGLMSPEGIFVNSTGDIFVTEDTSQGRILMIKGSDIEVIASSVGCPEGVAVDMSGTVWFTSGGFEAGEMFSSLWKVNAGVPERVFSVLSIFSLSDIEIGNSGIIYICSESAGITGHVSVLSFDPLLETAEPFVMNVPYCEGICMTDGDFPMYLASEEGTVFRVDSTGAAVPVVEGLESIEDVEVIGDSLFVTEDGTGLILRFALNGQ